MAEPPPAPEELWEEILLRLPLDDPASLLRASLVYKQWRRVASRRGFLRRLAELHGAPPILGLFTNKSGFVPITAGNALAFPAAPDSSTWRSYLDCRHGRVLLLHVFMEVLLVWEPITGYQQRVRLPAAVVEYWETFNAAVVCAVDGCVHGNCHGGPFRVVVVCAYSGSADPVPVDPFAWASEYSSETGAWGEPTPIQLGGTTASPGYVMMIDRMPSLLVGNSLYFVSGAVEIIKYDFGGHGLVVTVIQRPDINYRWDVKLMHAEDGRLGVVVVEGSRLQLWSLWMCGDTDGDADAGWVLRRTIHLENLLPAAALLNLEAVYVTGFAEGMNVVFVFTEDGIFTIELKSGQDLKKLCQNNLWQPIGLPFALKPNVSSISFISPRPPGGFRHQRVQTSSTAVPPWLGRSHF